MYLPKRQNGTGKMDYVVRFAFKSIFLGFWFQNSIILKLFLFQIVNNYKGKSDCQSWREEDMKSAIEKVVTRKMGVNRAASTYKVPKTTFLRRITKYETTKDLNKATEKKLGQYKQIFSVLQEKELARRAKKSKKNLFSEKKEKKPAKVQKGKGEGKGKFTKKKYIKKKSKSSSEDEEHVRRFLLFSSIF